MKKSSARFDSACFYKGKKVGNCTSADSNSYDILMKECGGSASRVLCNYDYFSTELKDILETVMHMQHCEQMASSAEQCYRKSLPKAVNEKAAIIFVEPVDTPWGETQHCQELSPGVFSVSTAGHGGVMVRSELASTVFSAAARKCAFTENGYVCFEEDCDGAVAMLELLDKEFMGVPVGYRCTVSEFKSTLEDSVELWNPEYYAVRAKQARMKTH